MVDECQPTHGRPLCRFMSIGTFGAVIRAFYYMTSAQMKIRHVTISALLIHTDRKESCITYIFANVLQIENCFEIFKLNFT